MSVQPETLPVSYEKEAVLGLFLELHPQLDRKLIGRAYDYCVRAHEHQLRKSGEPYLQHPLEVAKILARQQLDSAIVAAGLLHDVVEDSAITMDELRNAFGEEVAQLVDGVTKITEVQLHNKEQRQAETFRKMLLSMAKDIRVILIKFADRLHNLYTLHFLQPEQIQKIATETMEVYAPLAHRLGMAQMRSEFEDLAFKHLYPRDHQELVNKIKETREERERTIEELAKPVRERLREEGMQAKVIGRPKHLYSIYRKMKQRDLPFDEIYDLFALRVIVGSVRECYVALGILHSLWNPLPARFKDYVASPKSNMYQSLHTTMVCTGGRMLEVQIRTEEMHRTAEAGIAAHWIYKEGRKFSASDEHMQWLHQIEEWQKDLSDSNEFLEFLKIDLFPAEVFIFTPKGDIIQLPKGATALDFAFAIHTNLGIYCIGCKINGRIMPIDTLLKSGSTVEILRSENQHPSMDWLRYVRTSRAKSALRRWLNQEGKIRSRDLGNEILKREFQNLNAPSSFEEWIALAARIQKIESPERLLEMVGSGSLSVLKILHDMPPEQIERRRFPTIRRIVDRVTGGTGKLPIRVKDNENLMIRLARCCMPIPGEKIVGFITKGRGIAIHSIRCANAIALASEKERCVPVEWDLSEKSLFKVRIEVIAKNRLHLLSELTRVISSFSSNIVNAHIATRQNVVHDIFLVEVVHLSQLKKIISAMGKVKGVQKITRGRLNEEEPPKIGP